jgi:hypothetical protein
MMTASPIARHDQTVGDVYGEKYGWRMFCSSFLTPDISDFLRLEHRAFNSLLKSDFSIEAVLEVGCGYGRHLELCHASNRQYYGIDLIDWLTEIGKWRQKVLSPYSKNCFQTRSVIDVNQVVDTFSETAQGRTLVYFPFNCLGNIPYLDSVFKALSRSRLRFAASVFNNHAQTSIVREEYYQKCGLHTQGNIELPEGAIIESNEGFSSIGFNSTQLISLAEKYGYILEKSVDISSLAQQLVFAPICNGDLADDENIAAHYNHFARYEPIPYQDFLANFQGNDKALVYYLIEPKISLENGSLLTFETAHVGEMDEIIANSLEKICPIGIVELYKEDQFQVIPIRW